jgi:hypothetical protein
MQECSSREARGSHSFDPGRMLKEEADHFPAGIRSACIGVRALRTAAGPGMVGALQDPLLQNRSPAVIALDRANEAHAALRSAANDGCLEICPELRLGDDVVAIQRIDRLIRVAMKHDGRNQRFAPSCWLCDTR